MSKIDDESDERDLIKALEGTGIRVTQVKAEEWAPYEKAIVSSLPDPIDSLAYLTALLMQAAMAARIIQLPEELLIANLRTAIRADNATSERVDSDSNRNKTSN